jgi:hypothetical protein
MANSFYDYEYVGERRHKEYYKEYVSNEDLESYTTSNKMGVIFPKSTDYSLEIGWINTQSEQINPFLSQF